MSFFRLRFINTLLLFFIGLVLGFIIKERFYPAAAPAPREVPQESSAPLLDEEAAAPDEDLSDEPYAETEAETWQPAPTASEPGENGADAVGELVIEPPGPAPASRPLAGEAATFFARPASYAGRELEMDLQMIMARKVASGWRLNLVHSGPAKKLDYLYVDDRELLGEKPDLRIGYVYKVRFLCGSGDPASGNTLRAIEHTGAKADWATGLSALE